MSPADFLLIGCIMAFAGLAQYAVGFGFALFASPLLLRLVLPLPAVITLIVTCSLLQALLGIHHLRTEVPGKDS